MLHECLTLNLVRSCRGFPLFVSVENTLVLFLTAHLHFDKYSWLQNFLTTLTSPHKTIFFQYKGFFFLSYTILYAGVWLKCNYWIDPVSTWTEGPQLLLLIYFQCMGVGKVFLWVCHYVYMSRMSPLILDGFPVRLDLAPGLHARVSRGSGRAWGGQTLSGQMIQVLHSSSINYRLITVM